MKLSLLEHKFAHLYSVDGKIKRVVDDDVVGGGDGALAHVLGDEEEVVPIPPGDGVVHHSPGRRIFQLLLPESRGENSVAVETERTDQLIITCGRSWC